MANLIAILLAFLPLSAGWRNDDASAAMVELDEVEAESENLTTAASPPWGPLLQWSTTRLGSGSFGTAELMKLKAPCEGQVVRKSLSECSFKKDWRWEIEAMRALDKNPNIINFIDAYPREEEKWCKGILGSPPKILMEVAKGGELQKFMDKVRPGWIMSRVGPSSDAKRAVRREVKVRMLVMALVDTLRGLVYMKEKGWVHRDIKADNIWEVTGDEDCMAAGTCSFVLGDIGLARKLDSKCANGGSPFPCHETFVWFNRATSFPQPVQAPEVAGGRFWASTSDAFHLAMTLQIIYLGRTVESMGGRIAEKTKRLREMFNEKEDYQDVPTDVRTAMSGVKQVLLDLSDDFQARPSVEEALARAEQVYQDLYSQSKAERAVKIPQCLTQCAECPQGTESCKVRDGALLPECA